MSVLEISSCIIDNVESMPETNDYIYIGIFFSFLLSLIPCFCRLCACVTIDAENPGELNYLDLPMMLWQKASFSFMALFRFAFGNTPLERTVLVIGLIQRICLTLILFMIFAVAERTFKQRLNISFLLHEKRLKNKKKFKFLSDFSMQNYFRI